MPADNKHWGLSDSSSVLPRSRVGENGQEVRIFLMNDSVNMARDVCKAPAGYDQDLSQMLKDLIANGVPVSVCGIYKNHPYFEGAKKSTMGELAEWAADSDKVLTF